MSADTSSKGGQDGSAGAGGSGNGSGGSGEGAGSAMEAMLRKRQMRVDPQSDTGSTTTQQQDGKRAEE